MMYEELALKRLNDSIDIKETGALIKHGRFKLIEMNLEQDMSTRTLTARLLLPNGIEITIEKGRLL